ALHDDQVAGPQRAVDREEELEGREAAALLAKERGREPERGRHVRVRRGEAVNVVRQRRAAVDVDLPRAHGVTLGVVEALEAARLGARLALRPVPRDAIRLRLFP